MAAVDWTFDLILSRLNIPLLRVTGGRKYYRCPRHEDRDPSLEISPQGWICGPCGKQGSSPFGLLAFLTGVSDTDTAAVIEQAQRLGLTADGNGGNGKQPAKTSPQDIIAWYDYRSEEGEILYRKARRANKEFSFYNPNTKKWSRDDDPVLFNLPAVIKAKRVCFVEGEKDALTLIKLGFAATTTDSGAGASKYNAQHRLYAPYLKGKELVIFYDADKPGIEHAKAVAMANTGSAEWIKVIDLPNMAYGEDVTNFVERPSNRLDAKAKLEALIEAAPIWTPSLEEVTALTKQKEKEWAAEPDSFQIDELAPTALAKRFAKLCAGELLYSSTSGKFYLWNGKFFEPTESEIAVHEVDDRLIADMKASRASLPRPLVNLLNKEIKSRVPLSKLNEILTLSKKHLSIQIELLDADPYLVNFTNGTLDLRTGVLRSHEPSDLITRILNYEYDSTAQSPIMAAHLRKVLPELDTRDALQEVAGLCLSGDASQQFVFLFIGDGGNGKSAFMAGLGAALGEYKTEHGYARQILADLLLFGADADRTSQMKAGLRRVRLAYAPEVDEHRSWNQGIIKVLTGEDSITGRALHRDFVTYQREFKTIIVLNDEPNVTGDSDAFWRRIYPIYWKVKISEAEMDDYFVGKLKAERAGIFNWALIGFQRFYERQRLAMPQSVVDSKKAYRKDQDIVEQFIEECCWRSNDEGDTTDAVYDHFRWWSARQGYVWTKTKTALTRNLGKKKITADVDPDSKRRYVNLRLKTESTEERKKEIKDAFHRKPRQGSMFDQGEQE